MISIYLISLAVFSTVIFVLVGILLLVEATVVQKGERTLIINDDEEKIIKTPSGRTLLAALADNGIYLPSACGGGGSCGMCKCRVENGPGELLPTELAHLSRKEALENVRVACQLKVRDDLRIRIADEILSIRKYQAKVVSNNNVATFIKELVLELDPGERLEFKAGAYLQIDIPPYDLSFRDFDIAEAFRPAWDYFNLWALRARSAEPTYRAYSMANTPTEKLLRFTVRIATPPLGAPSDIPPGIGSSYIFSLKPGHRLTLSGPYGEFFVKDTDREMCFIGGGAGMAPMRCHIFHQLLDVGTGRKITFWYGARSKKEMFYEEEFITLEKKFDNFSYNVALSEPQPEDNWEGLTGFIHQCAHDAYLAAHDDPTEIEYYLCGPPMMIDAVFGMLDSLGVDPEMIAFDDFG